MLRTTLNDPDVFPSDPVLARQLGKAKPAWDAFTLLLKNDYPQISPEWRYYNDGKSWLCKVTQKAKTICWVSAWDRFFKICFYFTAKAETAISASALDSELKHSFLHPKGKCSLRPVITEVRKKADLKPIKELIEIKLKLK
ncbi:MAG: DUF3788 domain-containing protein [Candidatus Aminicenantes bacterium]|nr:DUF3788 domain-containing protein [Candidatus Aminicenantes bacterium]